jgi:hypothetical protein
MYLIHAHLSGSLGDSSAADMLELLTRCRPPNCRGGIEHVTCHAERREGLVLGIFVSAPSLQEAETTAEASCRTALAARPGLGVLVDCSAAFVAAFYEEHLRRALPPVRPPERPTGPL